jgi:hypothetical protein
MNTRPFVYIASLLILLSFGCGGGGGGSDPVPTTISGVAAKGAVSGGTLKVFAVDTAGAVGTTPMGTVVTNADGTYAVNVGFYAGAILVEVTGGSYNDEATGVTRALTIPLRAAVAGVVPGVNIVAVTPLTELAVRKAGTPLTAAAVNSANAGIGAFFGVDNIITTLPTDATVVPAPSVTPAQKGYALVLATLSQLMLDSSKSHEILLNDLSTEIGGGVVTEATITALNSAMTTFAQGTRNQTGITTPALISLKGGVLKLASGGTLDAGNLIGAVDLTLNLPANVSVKATPDASNPSILVADQGAVVLSGTAAAAGITIHIATYTPAAGAEPSKVRIVLANSAGFGMGEFATVNCDIASGFPRTTDFTVPAFKASGGPDLQTNATLAGVTPVVSSFGAIVQ